eukprot:GFKZ01004353.1.p1 GENE.GFKZ01004353.1~~GFKZ01004353.1.p1  ORF type:complete len:1590 (-),score=188.47 GFKZ01004353.1:238-5007(-)
MLPVALLFTYLLLAPNFPPVLCTTPPNSRETTLSIPNTSHQSNTPTTTCTLTAHSQAVRKLLHVNGTADDVVYFSLCFNNDPTTPLTLVDSSSNPDVLRIAPPDPSDVALDRFQLDNAPCQNITATFSFDRMVGTTVYALQVRETTTHVICSTSVSFIVVGFSILQVSLFPSTQISARNATPPDVNTVVSGSSHQLRLHYDHVLVTRFMVLRIFVQFPDGTDSTSKSTAFLLDALTHLSMSSDTDATSPVFYANHCHAMPSARQLDHSACGCAIEVATLASTAQVTMWLRFEPYRHGTALFFFSWDFILHADHEFAHEALDNVLYVSVVGDPPPIVLDLYPTAPLRRTGGDHLTVVMGNTQGSNIRFLTIGILTCIELHDSYRQRPDGLYEAVYITQPGNGTNLPWDLHVSFPEGVTRTAKITLLHLHFAISYSTVVLNIRSISPPVGSAGDGIVLTGYFDGFDPDNSNHNVYIGAKTLRSLRVVVIVNDAGTQISFEAPSRAVIGAAYQYEVKVVVGAETTVARVTFTYKATRIVLEIAVYGASYDSDEQRYVLGGCAVSRFVASLPSGVPEPETFHWSVVGAADISRQNIVIDQANVSNDTRTLLLFPQTFGGKQGEYEVSAGCEINGEEFASTIVVKKQIKPVIGVTLSKPLPRSISSPNVPLRVVAVIMTPRTDCYNHTAKVIYRWSYGNETQEFSFRNFSKVPVNMSSTPAKLGREYVIPQSRLQVGNLSVSLHAYMEDEPAVFGRATISFSIIPAPLVPVIGYGASKILHSVATDLSITAEKSYDPDGPFLRNSTAVSHFEWGCVVYESLANESSSQECTPDLLPNNHVSSFTVTKQSLVAVGDSLASQGKGRLFFLQYSVVVAVDGRESAKQVQSIEVSPENLSLASLGGLRVVDNRGNAVDWNKVRYFDDLLIVPDGSNISWAFDIRSPVSSSLILKQPGNLILHPGYFDPTLSASTQSLPLGIKANALSPSQSYELAIPIVSSVSGVEKGESTIVFHTEDMPTLILPALPVVHGDSETAFTAFARVNLDSSHDFLYYFYLVHEDGERYCLDGCSGSPYVQFTYSEPGNFKILVKLMDMQGKTLFDEGMYNQSIHITANSFEVSALSESRQSLSAFEEMLRTIHQQGDHGSFELLVSSLSYKMRGGVLQSSAGDDTEVLDLAVDAMHQIVQNSAPTTMTSKSYVTTAARFASIDSEYFSSQGIMYTLFSMVDKAITQIPETEAYDVRQELLLFYNLSARHVISTLAGSSSRVRLQQFGSGSGLDARSLLIDMYRLQEEHLTAVLSRDAECGLVEHFDTVVSEGKAPSDINNFIVNTHSSRSADGNNPGTFDILSTYENANEKPSYSTFTLAVLCNPDQAKGIRGEASSFRWCDEVFRKPGAEANDSAGVDPSQKRVFSVMETIDYTWLSGISGDEPPSDTLFLVTTNISMVGNGVTSAWAPPKIHECYSVNTSMARLGVTSSRGCLSAQGFVVQDLGKPFEPKVLMRNLRRNFTAIEASVSSDGSSTILMTASAPGVFGAIGTDCPVSARKPTLALPYGEDTDFLYIVLGGVTLALVGVTITWAATSSAFTAYSGTAVAAA